MHVNKLSLASVGRYTRISCFCTQEAGALSKTTEKAKRERTFSNKSHKMRISRFLKSDEAISPYHGYIPPKYLDCKVRSTPESLYLVSSEIAKNITSHVLPIIRSQEHQTVCETNPGLGLIARELLDNGVNKIRLYESCGEFQAALKELFKKQLDEIELYSKDLFKLSRYAYIDRHDQGNRVESLLNVPKKSWSSDPSMTVIGSMTSSGFLKFLLKSLVMQDHAVSHGRIQIFATMPPRDYAILSATPKEFQAYKFWTVLFDAFLEFELLDKFERKYFIPWQTNLSPHSRNRYPTNLDPDLMYFVRINFKKEMPLPGEQILQYFHFLKQFFGTGTKAIIPVIEKWIPDCGHHIIVPTLQHEDYFENLGIFTKFRELNPKQILAVFKEMVAFPSFDSSQFLSMIEEDLIKSDTIETELHDDLERKVMQSIDSKVDLH